jgi:hypothetical protein
MKTFKFSMAVRFFLSMKEQVWRRDIATKTKLVSLSSSFGFSLLQISYGHIPTQKSDEMLMKRRPRSNRQSWSKRTSFSRKWNISFFTNFTNINIMKIQLLCNPIYRFQIIFVKFWNILKVTKYCACFIKFCFVIPIKKKIGVWAYGNSFVFPQLFSIEIVPVRIWVRIDTPHPLVCRKRRRNGVVLRMRPEKPRPRVTAGVAR